MTQGPSEDSGIGIGGDWIENDQFFRIFKHGPMTTLSTGPSFPEWADVHWCRLLPAPGPTGTYNWKDRRVTGPLVRLHVVVHDGRPEVDEVIAERQAGGPEVTATALCDIPLRAIVDRFVEQMAMLSFGASLFQDVEDFNAGYKDATSAAAATRRRRTVDDELLREVAEVHRNDLTFAPVKAVQEHFHTSRRNAARWVALARERGFVPPYWTEDKS
jgi:hypothetical protein